MLFVTFISNLLDFLYILYFFDYLVKGGSFKLRVLIYFFTGFEASSWQHKPLYILLFSIILL